MEMDSTALYYALSTIAQCASVLAALIGFLSLWRLDRLREDQWRAALQVRNALPHERSLAGSRTSIDVAIQTARGILAAPEPGEQEAQLEIQIAYEHWDAIRHERGRLGWVLTAFLVITLVLILAPAIIGIIHVEWLKTCPWTPTLVYLGSVLLAITPAGLVIYGGWRASRRLNALLSLVLLLSLVPMCAAPGSCVSAGKTAHQGFAMGHCHLSGSIIH